MNETLLRTPGSAAVAPAIDGEAAWHALPSALLHDLRTPLNQILGYSQMMVEQAQESSQDELVPDLQKVRAAGQQLLALIDTNFHPILTTATEAVSPSAGPETATRAFSTEPAGRDSASETAYGVLLVVDDNERNRDVLSRYLERRGYVVAVAENGRQALEMMCAHSFDLVLLDIMMPEMDGYETLQSLKADDRLRHIPVIMMSALNELDSVVRCIELGAEDYLPKPFNPTLLKARIGACLEKKRAHDREVRFTEELQESYRRLKELERLRDDLTNMIIHDLRTPLVSVIAGMQTLNLVGDLNESQLEMMGISISGGETLLSMINDLLDVEKIESGALHLEYAMLSAAELVAGAFSQVSSLAESKNLTLVQRIDADLPLFKGDEGTLRRTLVNLLGNAIKFTPARGAVTVTVQLEDDGRSLLFRVSDTGEGIPPEAFGLIFEKFGQVETRTEGRKHSTGLGLTFCKLVVEAHGGRIWVGSEIGKGSTFFFTISLEAR